MISIDDFVKKIDSNVDAIATAAQEQAMGLSEVTRAVNELDRTTQENGAMSARTIEISEVLQQGADALTQPIALVKLNRRATKGWLVGSVGLSPEGVGRVVTHCPSTLATVICRTGASAPRSATTSASFRTHLSEWRCGHVRARSPAQRDS